MKFINMIRKKILSKRINRLKKKSVKLLKNYKATLKKSIEFYKLIELHFKFSNIGNIASIVWLNCYLDDYLNKYTTYKINSATYLQNYNEVNFKISTLQEKYNSL